MVMCMTPFLLNSLYIIIYNIYIYAVLDLAGRISHERFQNLSTATENERTREREGERERANIFVMAYTVTVHSSVPTDLTRTGKQNSRIST